MIDSKVAIITANESLFDAYKIGTANGCETYCLSNDDWYDEFNKKGLC